MTGRVSKAAAPVVRLVAEVPAGEYWVGDPCYSVPNALWMEWLEAADYHINDRNHVLAANIDGRLAVGVSTRYGDGVYEDGSGRRYPVDAGVIGLVPVEVLSPDAFEAGRHRVTFDEPARCFYANGVIHLGPITIDTKN